MNSLARLATLLATVAASTVVVTTALPSIGAAAATEAYSVNTGLVVRDVIHDPIRDVVYASVDRTDPRYPDQIVTIDPDTYQVLRAESVGAVPANLAISGDGSALFVGFDEAEVVRKVALPSFAIDWSQTLGADDTFFVTAGELAAVPGSSDSVIAVTRHPGLSPSNFGVAVIDRNGVRPALGTGYGFGGSIAVDDTGARLFTSNIETSDRPFRIDTIGAAGITLGPWTSMGGGRIAHVDGLVFQSNGLVIDVGGATPSVVATLASGDDVAIDRAAARAFVVGVIGGSGREVRMYDVRTRALVGEWWLRATTGSVTSSASLGSGALALIDRQHPAHRQGALVFADVTRSPVPPATVPPATVPPATVPPVTVPPATVPPVTVPPVTVPPVTVPPVTFPSFPSFPPLPPTTAPSNGSPSSAGGLGSYGEYTALTPERILDTRWGLGRSGLLDDLGPGESIDVAVTGLAGVPLVGVDAVVINVTATMPSASSYLTIWPTGLARPTISSLNVMQGRTVANLVTMPVGENGRVSVFNASGTVEVIFDIAGFYSSVIGPDGTRFHAVPPTRALDTRTPAGGGAIGPQESRQLSMRQTPLVATTASAVVLNVTVAEPTTTSFLTVSPSDVPRPVVSNLNFQARDTRANQVVVRVPADGTIAIYNHLGTAHVVVDVVGYYDDVEFGDSGRFVPVQPYRALDTRIESPWPSPGHLPVGGTLQLIDDSVVVSAIVFNVTVTETIGNGYVTAYPVGNDRAPAPLASTLNYVNGDTVPNHAIVPTAPYVAFYNAGGRVQLVVDVFGLFI